MMITDTEPNDIPQNIKVFGNKGLEGFVSPVVVGVVLGFPTSDVGVEGSGNNEYS